jgi:N-acetyl-alpha-D-muramate 1-phosphate uridylyltransferase
MASPRRLSPYIMSDARVAILAGGRATRLRPLTDSMPKSLVVVAGKPFLTHQLELLNRQGIRHVVLCVGHFGELIQRQFGDGTGVGIRIDYSFDGPTLLGTGGAIKRALPLLGENFLVLYGDSYLLTSYARVADCFYRSGKLGCMAVYRNEGRYDRSNVVFTDGVVRVYDKNRRLPEMQFIDYGLSMFNTRAFDTFPPDKSFDLADVVQYLILRGQLAGWEVTDRFYEIGSPAGLLELDRLLNQKDARG